MIIASLVCYILFMMLFLANLNSSKEGTAKIRIQMMINCIRNNALKFYKKLCWKDGEPLDDIAIHVTGKNLCSPGRTKRDNKATFGLP